ncbi:LLM class flavin-dependent oxidoreductase [Aeromicrobium sp. Marseille-Q0843]|uniref:LLM class flavin-dependent oxidoreductase n=1 Tax=Aeromicrobium phoceense TaxID=2754045 RepID=A0A838XNL3_9ACTN|nr:LLM class flavin-dependent oxidoreductase [Aeromicrobium phoceense]MBA4608553.1 LLM class flavin-dependent oxidoreductase [Aeromicrobium phoceense]
MTRQLSLNAFLHDTGHHEASWRHPDSAIDRIHDIDFDTENARIAEEAKLDAIFFADAPGLWGATPFRPAGHLEPITRLAAIAARTERIGLIATASTTFYDPYNLARLFSSLDTISKGRAGWNIVTTQSEAVARNFSLSELPSASERYVRAQEFIDVVTKLWDSWEDDAILADRESGRFFDQEKVHAIHHVGNHFQIEGPLSQPRSPQGRPVYVQAGSSNDGRAFAGRNAEAIFTAHQTIEDAQAFYADIKSRAVAFGRSPEDVKILPGISPFVADTRAEAEELQRYVNSLTVPAYGIAQLEGLAGVSLAHLELDEPVPVEVFGQAGDVLDNSRSRLQVIANIVERDRPTLRGLLHRLAGARGHNVVAGTPTEVADIITEWFQNGAADGFNVMPPLYPQLLQEFTQKVVPILQDRGLFRTEYTGSTLRDHFGLARPESLYGADANEEAHVV